MENCKRMKVSSPICLAGRLGLRMVKPDALTIRRAREGDGWAYTNARGRRITDPRLIARLNKLAVPPAYEDVRYASDPKAHLQAIGRDAAGRLQYRYHSEWEKIRDIRKAQRLIGLVEVLPKIRRALSARLAEDMVTREFALAAMIELLAVSAIRSGSEEYVKLHRTRGAATLLKSNVRANGGDTLVLSFRAKGGKPVKKEIVHARLCAAIARLREIPGSRLFQYRTEEGTVRTLSAADANAYLREIAGCPISLKDFRTLCGTAEAMEALAAVEPAESARARKKQIVEAIKSAAATLENTPAICRKSYVHPAVVTALRQAGRGRGRRRAAGGRRRCCGVVQAGKGRRGTQAKPLLCHQVISSPICGPLWERAAVALHSCSATAGEGISRTRRIGPG
jgi:DNA topoisomerase I